MAPRRVFVFAMLAAASIIVVQAQEQTPSAPQNIGQDAPVPQLLPGSARPVGKVMQNLPQPVLQTVSLTVPKGASLQVSLEREVRIKRVGQCVQGLVVEPVYAFDRLVVPAGARVRGEVTRIEPLSGGKRTLAGLDGDFTPPRQIEIRFTDLALADGKHIPLKTSVTPGSGQILKFVSAPEKESKKTVKGVASEKAKEAKQQAKDEWNNAMKQLKTSGRLHRLARHAEAQLPVHHQYIPSGTMYFAELEEPLAFGNETLTPERASSLGGQLPDGSVVHARLTSPLSSATAQKGQAVEAVLTRPLLDGQRLVLPQGSRLKGTVRQVRAARRMKRNGQLRIAFEQVVPPDGLEQKVQATLIGVQAGKEENVKLDSEGGAEATTSKSRFGSVALSLGLAAIAAKDSDGDSYGPAGSGGSARGFKLLGLAAARFAHSRTFGYASSAYGAGMTIYRNFVARGHEVVFPKNTAMEISIGTRAAVSPPPVSGEEAPPNTGAGDAGQ